MNKQLLFDDIDEIDKMQELYDEDEEDEVISIHSDDDIEMEDLEGQSYRQLVKIAKSLGATSKGRKENIIKSIKRYKLQGAKEKLKIKKQPIEDNSNAPDTPMNSEATPSTTATTVNNEANPTPTTTTPVITEATTPTTPTMPTINRIKKRQPKTKTTTPNNKTKPKKPKTTTPKKKKQDENNKKTTTTTSTPMIIETPTAPIIPFNTSIFNLKIKDIENLELVFWKVVKNKVLFKYLTSHIRVNKFSPTFNELVDVFEMILDGQKNLLVYKLKHGFHLDLTFGNRYATLSNGQESIGYIISTVKDDVELYQLLFERYPELTKYRLEQMAGEAIEKSNLVVLSLLVEKYQYQPKSVAPVKSSKIVKYLFDKVPTIFSDGLTSAQWENIKSRCGTDCFKMFNTYLEIYNDRPPTRSTLDKIYQSWFNYDPYAYSFKLKHLIYACKSMSKVIELLDQIVARETQIRDEKVALHLSTINNNNTSSPSSSSSTTTTTTTTHFFNRKKKKEKKTKRNSFMLSSQIIESVAYSKEQLGLPIHNFRKKDSHVKLLMKMYLSNNNSIDSNLCYLMAFTGESSFSNVNFSRHVTPSSIVMDAFKNGNADFVRKWLKSNGNQGKADLENRIATTYDFKDFFLFEYIKDDKEAQYNFIADLIADYKDPDSPAGHSLNATTLFNIITIYGDIDLIDFAWDSLERFPVGASLTIAKHIKSTKTLDYFFSKDVQTVTTFNYSSWFSMGELGVSLFSRFFELVEKNKSKFTSFVYPKYTALLDSIKISSAMCKFILSNPSVFTSNATLMTRLFANILKIQDLPNVQYVIENSSYPYKGSSSNWQDESVKTLFIDYIYNNRKMDIDSKRCDFLPNTAFFETGRIAEFKKVDSAFLFSNSNFTRKFVENNKVDLIVQLISNLFPTESNSSDNNGNGNGNGGSGSSSIGYVLSEILTFVVEYNRLEILKAIYQNFPFMFNVKVNSKNPKPIFKNHSIKRLLINSIQHHNFEMVSFFLDPQPDTLKPIVKLTSKQLKNMFSRHFANSFSYEKYKTENVNINDIKNDVTETEVGATTSNDNNNSTTTTTPNTTVETTATSNDNNNNNTTTTATSTTTTTTTTDNNQ